MQGTRPMPADGDHKVSHAVGPLLLRLTSGAQRPFYDPYPTNQKINEEKLGSRLQPPNPALRLGQMASFEAG